MTHKLRPSDAPRWTVCAGAPAFTAGMEDKGSDAAALGTAKHTLAEMMASMDFADAKTMIGAEINGFAVDDGFADQVNWATQQVADLTSGEDAVLLEMEQRLPMPFLGDDASGTLDVLMYLPATKQVVAADYKFGHGVRFADDPQLHCYGVAALDWAAAEGHDVESVKLVIVQPPLHHRDEFVLDVAAAGELKEQLASAAADTFADDPVFTPDETACKWCLGKTTCPALRGKVADTVPDGMFTDLDAEADSPEQMAADKLAIPLIRQWCDAREMAAYDAAVSGVELPGFKLVEGKKGARAFTDTDAVMELVNKKFRIPLAQACNMTVKTAPQMLKMMKERGESAVRVKQVEALITRKQGKPALVPADAKGDAISVAQFENLEK